MTTDAIKHEYADWLLAALQAIAEGRDWFWIGSHEQVMYFK